MEKARFLRHTNCDECGSSDANSLYENGSAYCFSCGHWSLWKDKKDYTPMETQPGAYRSLRDRGISKETCEKYGIEVFVVNDAIVTHKYPYFDGDEYVANKLRHLPKTFTSEGEIQKGNLFGQQLFPKASAKSITITEGELDAVSVYQMQGSRWPTVSLKNGAQAVSRDIKANLEYLESFQHIYICFDADPQGQAAALQAAQLLSPGKAKIIKMDPKLKDANGYLVAGKQEEFVKTWWQAELWTPAGILASSELKARIRNRRKDPGLPYPWDGLNKKVYGIRRGEAVIVTADTGVGKTALLREIEFHILQTDPHAKVGTIFLEETPEDSGLGLVSVAGSIPFHLPDATYSDSEYTAAERILEGDRIFFYDSFGSTRVDEIISRVRYLVKGLDCRYILIDHLSIMVSDQMQGDERKKLDEVMTKLKTLTIELDMALIAIVHKNRQGQIRGTAAIEQLANIVIDIERDQINPNATIRSTAFVTVTKNRFSGNTGPACALLHDFSSGRLNEVNTAFPDMEEFH
jgi:twinkle protein